MRLRAVGHLVAHAGSETEGSSVAQLRLELSLEAENDVALLAPVVSPVPGGILHHSDTGGAELARVPSRDAGSAAVLGRRNGEPVRRAERDVGQLHERIVLSMSGDAER